MKTVSAAVIKSRRGFLSAFLCIGLLTAIEVAARADIDSANTRVLANLSQLTEAFSGSHSLYIPFTAWEWQGFSTDGGEPWWVDCSEWPCLDLSPASTNVNGVPLFTVRLTKNVLTGEITIQSDSATGVVARIEAPSGYQPGALSEDRGVMWMWQQATNCPDCWGLEGEIPPPTVALKVFLADVQNKPTWDEAVATQEAAWEQAQAEAVEAQAEMLALQDTGGVGDEMLMDSDPCVITNEADPFVVLSIVSNTNGVTLTWQSCGDHLYEVQAAAELSNPTPWLVLETLIGEDGTTSWTDTATVGAQLRFYRVTRLAFDGDADQDGLSNIDEFNLDTDLRNPDTDGDGMPDGWEVEQELDPKNSDDAADDPDNDGWSNLEEYLFGTDPYQSDPLPDMIVNGGQSYASSTTISIQPLSTNYPNIRVSSDATMTNATVLANAASISYALTDTGDGRYDLYLQYADAQGAPRSPVIFRSVTLDRVAPVVSITSPASNAVLDQAFITLQSVAYDSDPMEWDTARPLTVWINDELFWDRSGTSVVKRLAVPLDTNSFSVTVRAADAAGHTNQASRTWTINTSGDTTPPHLTNFNIGATLLVPDVSEVWLEATSDDENALVDVVVNDTSTARLNVRERKVEGLVPLEPGTNTVVVNARDAAGNMTSTNLTIISSTRFRVAITSPAFGEFASGESNYVSGYVSAKFDEGLPTETNVTSVTINGIAAVVGTNLDADGNVPFASVQKIPLGVPITGTIGGPGIPTDPPPTIPPAMSQQYEVTQKYTWSEDPPVIPTFVGSSCDFDGPCTSLFRERQARIATVSTNQPHVDVQTINESWTAQLCVFDANPDGLAWTQTDTNTQFSTASGPEDRSLAIGVSSYYRELSHNTATIRSGIDAYGNCHYQSSSAICRGFSRSRDGGFVKFLAPRQYDTNTTVVFTFEGVDYKRRDGVPLDLSQIKFRGQDPFTYSNQAQTVSYLMTVDGGQEYQISEDDFQWPADQTNDHYTIKYVIDSSPCAIFPLRVDNVSSTEDFHWLSWENFHNAKPEIDILGLDPVKKRDPGGLVVCNCATNNPTRSQIIIQKLTNTDASIVFTIPSQIKVFTAMTNGTEVASGTIFSNSNLPTNLWVEGVSVSTNMRDAQLTVAVQGATNSSDYVNFTVVWADLVVKISGNLDTDDHAIFLDHGNWPTAYGGYNFGGGTGLGPIDCVSTPSLNYGYTIGKIEAKATLHPSSIGTLISDNAWDMARTRYVKAWSNGALDVSDPPQGLYDANNSDTKSLTPINGAIFSLDAPGSPIFGPTTNINHSAEVYDNFHQYVTVALGGTVQTCSVVQTWSYTARVDADNPTNKVQLNSLSTSLLSLPTTPYYSPR